MKLGADNIDNILYGSKTVRRIYLNNKEIYFNPTLTDKAYYCMSYFSNIRGIRKLIDCKDE